MDGRIMPKRGQDLDAYLKELREIEDNDVEDGEEDPPREIEGEAELSWLKDAGFKNLVAKFEAGKDIDLVTLRKETLTLTKSQAAAVQRRVETLNATLRVHKQNRHSAHPTILSIFPQADTGDSTAGDSSVVEPADQSQPPVVMREKNNIPAASRISIRNSYGMTGDSSVADSATQGVEMISIQSKAQDSVPTKPSQSEDNPTERLTFIQDPPTQNQNAEAKNSFIALSPAPEPLGITRSFDLSPSDRERVRNLALVELTSLFDTHNLPFTRQKSKYKAKDSGLFGVPLQTLLEHDQKKFPNTKVPRFLKKLIEFIEKTGLEEEGILRVPGSATRIKELRKELDEKFYNGKFKWEDIHPNDAAGLIKQFIRELPVPLLTFEYLAAFAQVESIPDFQQKIQALSLLVLLLPDVHSETLRMLVRLLKNIDAADKNRMNLINLAMIMAPNLFLVQQTRKRQKTKAPKNSDLHFAAGSANIIRMLVFYQHILWIVPPALIGQIRQKLTTENQKSREKSIMKFLGRKDKSGTKKTQVQDQDYSEGVIRIQIPHVSRHLNAYSLNQNTTASDIVDHFKKDVPTPSPQHRKRLSMKRRGSDGHVMDSRVNDKWFLCEKGGNIGERMLDGSTNMLALLHTNPNAFWVLRIIPDYWL